MKIVFSTADEHTKFLCDGLNSFNENHNVIPYENEKDFGFYAYENGRLIGGVYGSTDMGNWAHIELLFVDGKYRNKGIGTKLLSEAEAFAKKHGCTGIHLNTWDWQAKDFYGKAGFAVFGELQNHPPGGSRYYMKKQL